MQDYILIVFKQYDVKAGQVDIFESFGLLFSLVYVIFSICINPAYIILKVMSRLSLLIVDRGAMIVNRIFLVIGNCIAFVNKKNNLWLCRKSFIYGVSNKVNKYLSFIYHEQIIAN